MTLCICSCSAQCRYQYPCLPLCPLRTFREFSHPHVKNRIRLISVLETNRWDWCKSSTWLRGSEHEDLCKCLTVPLTNVRQKVRVEPHRYRCTSPQLIALCVGVSPLYSTPDKVRVCVRVCVSAWCLLWQMAARSDERVWLQRHATSYAIFISPNIWQNYKKIILFGLGGKNSQTKTV